MKNIISLILTRYEIVICIAYLVIFATLPSTTAAVESAFADTLFREGDYLNAAHEYKRLLFLHPDVLQSDFIAFRIAASYQNAGKLEDATRAYQFLINTYPQSSLVARAKNNVAQCQILSGNSNQGLESLKRFLVEHKESTLAPRAHFTIGLLHIEQWEWTEATKAWDAIPLAYPESPFAEISNRLTKQVKNMEMLPRRSAAIAGTLSGLMPGIGQIYTGQTVDGIYAFISVVVLGSASFYYADQGRYEVAIPVGILGAFFYGNSIYQSIRNAQDFNRQQEQRFRNKVQQEIRDSGLFGTIPPPKNEVKLVLWKSRF